MGTGIAIGIGIGPFGSGAGFSPAALSNLALWLRADTLTATPVQDWPNRGSLGGTFSEADVGQRPAWTASDADLANKPSVAWDDTDDLLTSSVAATNWKFLHDGTGMTIAGVIRATAGGFMLNTNNATAANGVSLDWNHNAANAITFLVFAGAVAIINVSGALASATKASYVARYVEGGSPEFSLRINGTTVASGASGAAPAAGDPVTALQLGNNAAGAVALGGKMPEFVGYNRSLSDAEVVQLEGYLRGRYALP